MFTFSLNWLQRLNNKKLDLNEVSETLDLQGLEVKKVTDFEDDKVVTIEVKANRPDALYHRGILREITAFAGEAYPADERSDQCNLTFDNNKFDVEIKLEDANICKRFSALIIRGINIKKETPKYIEKALKALSINTINPVVDILNYVMFEMGQPMHSYNLNKITGKTLQVTKTKETQKIITLDGSEVDIPKDCIVISDQTGVLSVAGIIGGLESGVDETTTDILIESANFNDVDIRLASKALKISTPSSYRFERGVDITGTTKAMNACAEMIVEVCGGKIDEVCYDSNSDFKKNTLQLRRSRTNDILGTDLSLSQIEKCMNQYYFSYEVLDEDTLDVEIPSYRLDLLREIDLIEEVARIYGYHNIEPTMPVITANYVKNTLWENMNEIRNIMTGLGFYEMINYSFIPSNSMEIMNVKEDSPLYTDVLLQNPISQNYALMRPTLIYSLLNNVIYNITRDNKNLALYEIGRTYFKDDSMDTGYREEDMMGIIFTGIRLEKGWGITNDIKYSFYDMANYLTIIFNSFGMSYIEKPNQLPIYNSGTGYDIEVNGNKIGFFGQVDKNFINKIPNGKLIQNEVFYLEFNLKYIKKNKKTIKYISKYQPVTREYNFLVSKNLLVNDIITEIMSTSELIKKITVKDIYSGKGVQPGKHSILFQIKYESADDTLSSEQIVEVEEIFINDLKEKMGITLKDI